MKLCPICENWRKSTSKQIAVAICGQCFAMVDNERAMIGSNRRKKKVKADER
jgi:hypothetical protein